MANPTNLNPAPLIWVPYVPRENKAAEKTGLFCHKCFETETTLWRNGPEGPKTLCNRCGLKYAKGKKRCEKISIQALLNSPVKTDENC